MQIFITDKHGETTGIDVSPNDTVEILKKQIEQTHPELPAERQVLIYQGVYMKNKRTLAESKVIRDSTLRVVLEG